MQIAIPSCLHKPTVFLLAAIAVISFPVFSTLQAQSNASQQQISTDKPYVIEYYYKAKWGHADEFIALFKKNHYPVLKKEIEMGRILEVHGTQPRLHGTEDGRWDYRITIVFKNASIANDSF